MVTHGREFCPICWRKLPVSVQSVILGHHVNITKQAKKATMKVAKRILRGA